MQQFKKYLYAIWYKQYQSLSFLEKILCGCIFMLLLPLSYIYKFIISIRKIFYTLKISTKSTTSTKSVKIIVIGNIVVGGAGKTPVVIALVKALQSKKLKIGVISRGYGVNIQQPIIIRDEHNSQDVGDEPLLIYVKTQVPICIHPNRSLAIHTLLKQYNDLDIIISDDGLQHLALKRDVECVVFNDFGIGNGFLLPAGPLREPIRKWNYTICTHDVFNNKLENIIENTHSDMIYIRRRQTHMYQHKTPNNIVAITKLAGQDCVLIAGIAHPQKIQEYLIQHANTIMLYPMQDHEAIHLHKMTHIKAQYPYIFTWIMTEKDYVKCHADLDIWLNQQTDIYTIWILTLEVDLPSQWINKIIV
jgi:tetraacyldisaccharide 4'-kinase